MIDRHDEEAARDAFLRFIPDEGPRQAVAETMANVVDIIASAEPSGWSVTLRSRRVSVNTSTRMIFGVRPSAVWIGVSGNSVPEGLKKLVKAESDEVTFAIDVENYFRWLPIDTYLEHRQGLDQELYKTAKYFATKGSKAPWRASHSPNVLAYLATELNRTLPEPKFAIGVMISGTQADTFPVLFDQFANEYLESPKGTRHLQIYGESREAARANWADLQRRFEAGEDVTEQILRQLIPHKDTKKNRDRGAWIHVAPVVNGEIQYYFAQAGLVRPNDWARPAKAIFDFVRSCINDPSHLADHCQAFDRVHVKGIQAAFLSPILNALAPQNFAIYNMKPREVVQRFTGLKLGAKLVDYPAANQAIRNFISFQEVIASEAASRNTLSSDLFDCFCHWFITERDDDVSDEESAIEYWKIAPDQNAQLWPKWLEEGICSIGWSAIGDVSKLTRDEFRQKVEALAPAEGGTGPDQVWHFASIPEGSFVIANRGTREILGIGRVTGPYFFVPDDEHGHRLPVEWIDTAIRSIDEGGWRRTMVRLKRSRFEELRNAAPKHPLDVVADVPAPTLSAQSRESYSIDVALRDLFMERSDFERILRSLERKQNVILEGPPGVGKTFIAKRIAQVLIGFKSDFHIQQIQFHQSYSYEDFIQGWRPNGGGGFNLKNGVFYDFCTRASNHPGDKFVFIIDEINRGNLSKIFGELMMLIEADKRGEEWAMPLTYAKDLGDRFQVPANLYLLGMLNTADRSLAMVDYALRRRFTFHQLMPEFHSPAFRKHLRARGASEALINRIVTSMSQLNQQIADDEKHLGRGFEIGHSFFCGSGTTCDEKWFAEVVESEIRPLVREYWFDDPSKATEMMRVFGQA